MGSPFLLVPMGPVAVAARSWRHRGRPLLTVIVKATFDLRHDAVMEVAQPAPIVTDERHFQNDPSASVARGSDLALVVPSPEFLVIGCAFPGGGRRAAATTVRLTVHRGHAVLLDKQLDVVGELRGRPGAPVPAPAPFDRMPILYERAHGGVTSRDNPVGRGMEPERDGLVSYPNVRLPQGGGVSPAGLGPIPSSWPTRRAHRGSLPAAAANTQLDVDVPADFQDTYFQVAPADQRVQALLGGELVTLVHLHPQLETLRTYLPMLRGAAMLQSARGDRVPVPLRMDTVYLEPEAMRAEIVFRGVVDVPLDRLARMHIAGALEAPDRPFVFPDLTTVRPSMPDPNTSSGASFSGTMMIEDSPPVPPQGAFAGRRPPPPAPPPPGPDPTRAFSGTVMLSPDASPAPAPGQPAASLPFEKMRRRRSGQLPAIIAAKAATPWSADPKAVKVQSATGITSTLLADDVDVPAPAQPPAPLPAPPPPDPPAHLPAPPPPDPAPPKRDPSKSPWREDPAAAPVVTAPAAPKPVMPPRTDVKGSLYKKAKR